MNPQIDYKLRQNCICFAHYDHGGVKYDCDNTVNRTEYFNEEYQEVEPSPLSRSFLLGPYLFLSYRFN